MLWRLAETLDKAVIHMAHRSIKRSPRTESRITEARALLKHPDFFCDFATLPPDDLTFLRHGNFSFTSAYKSSLEFNNTVWGKLYPSSGKWQKHPTLILLHGWNGEKAARFLFPLLAKRLTAAGINGLMFELPFHGKRKPAGTGISGKETESGDFISYDLERMVKSTRQSVADARSLIGWLKSLGCPWVGACGISLGGWLTGLVSCVDPRLSCAVLVTPIARIDRTIESLAFCEPIRMGLDNEPHLHLEGLNLISHSPKVPRDQILILKSEHDLFAIPETIEELWNRWGKPHIYRYRRSGHISILLSPLAMNRITKFVIAHAGAPESQHIL